MHPARYHVLWTRSSRRTKTNVIFLLVVFMLVGVLTYLQAQKDPIAEARIHEEVRDLLLKAGFKQYGVECSPTTRTCFQVVDTVLEDRKKFDYLHNSLLSVARYMTLVNLRGYSNSGARLKAPEKLTWENSNSSQWPVDKIVVPVGYFQMMILAPFCTEALDEKTTNKQRVLMLGLGGGTIPNFLSVTDQYNLDIETTVVELDPFMVGLATKYFEFKPIEGRTKLIVDDGVKALREFVQKGEKFKSVLLDACYSSEHPGLLCPVQEFFTRETIKDIYTVLEDKGTLSINTVFSSNATEWQHFSKKKFMEFFPACDFVSYARETKMLVCSKMAGWSWQEQGARFKQNLLRMNKLFGFQLGHVV